MNVQCRLIIWLNHADTDNKCSDDDKNIVNYGAFQCLETERAKIEKDLRKILIKRNDIQDNVCKLLR